MTYKKPNIEILGIARVFIESMIPKAALRLDWASVLTFGNPAYDLDE